MDLIMIVLFALSQITGYLIRGYTYSKIEDLLTGDESDKGLLSKWYILPPIKDRIADFLESQNIENVESKEGIVQQYKYLRTLGSYLIVYSALAALLYIMIDMML